jgi:hypothetical protein
VFSIKYTNNIVKRVELTDANKELLLLKIKAEDNAYPKNILWAVFFFSIVNFIPGKRKAPSLYSQYGFWKPLIFELIIFGAYGYYKHIKTINTLQNDMEQGEKIVKNHTVWKKDKAFSREEYRIWIDSDVKEFQKFNIDKQDYEAIHNGHTVTIEFFEKAKVLFNLDLHLTS